jgi:arginine/lysine/ornithine decarboxylase
MSPNDSYDDAAPTKFSVALLDGTNFELWKSSMTAFLQSKGLFKFVTERGAELLATLQGEKREEHLDKDERALGYIKCSISNSYLDVVQGCTEAKEAWDKLATFFAGKEVFNKIHLLEQLIDGKLSETGKPADDVQKFIREKGELVRRLAATGLVISEELQVAIMLARLPESFDTMRRIMESKPDLKVLDLSAELSREAIRRGSKRKREEVEAAHVASASSTADFSLTPNHPKKMKREVSKKYCTYCMVKGHEINKCWLNPKSSSFRPEFKDKLLKSLSKIGGDTAASGAQQ